MMKLIVLWGDLLINYSDEVINDYLVGKYLNNCFGLYGIW